MSRTTPPDQDTQILALVKAQAATRAHLTDQAVAVARNSASSFTAWYDTDQITEWASGVAGQIEAIQRVLAQSTDAYLARILSILTGKHVRPVGRIDVNALRQGVTHPGAYGRAADAYRYQQSLLDSYTRSLVTADNPSPPDLVTPIDAAVLRAVKVADMDAQLAARAQSQKSLEDAKGLVTGYRRVIHPEESRGGSCGLCVAASDRLYHVKELLPIHDRCECTVVPVVGEADPGSNLNQSDLNRLYKEAGSTGRADLKATRYQIDEHGELGPVLNKQGVQVRTARQAARDTSELRPAKSPEQKVADLRRVRDSLTPAVAKAKALADADPAKWDGYLHQLEARLSDLDHQLAA